MRLRIILFFSLPFILLSGCDNPKHPPPKKPVIQKKQSIVIDTPVFHIKAKYWYSCKWAVCFTNDNFDSEENIMNCWDGSGKFVGNMIVHQLKIFDTEEDAVRFAKRFNTWEKCRRWNDSVSRKAERLTQYRNNHPVEKENLSNQVPSCKNEEGKEVIIY